MSKATPSPGAKIAAIWNRLAPLPGGRRLFSRAIGWFAPYSGTVGAQIVALEAGYARVELADRRRVRNHLDSIHAVALVNLGEITSGLAVLVGLPEGIRGIVIELATEYVKKARGRLTAECRCEIPEIDEATEHEIRAEIRDESGEVVARVTARWLLSPAEERENLTQ